MRAFLLTFIIVTALVLGTGTYAWRRVTTYLSQPIDSAGGKTQVVIAKGATFKAITTQLEHESLVTDVRVFELYGRWIGAGTNIKAGTYEVDRSWSPQELLDKLQSGGLVPQLRVTIPEGYNRWQVADLLSAAGLVSREKFLARVERDDLEGRLFPDTYWLKVAPPAENVDVVLDALTARFEAVYAELLPGAPDEARLRADPETRRRLIIFSSLIEKEAQADADRALIARVFVNRVEKGMKLETDPTCVYGASTYKEVPHPRFCKDPDNEYSTYMIAGLPPTAIANAGRKALDAALRPAKGAEAARLLFFVAKRDGTGEHHFSATHEEHSRAVDRYLRGGGP